MDPGNLNENDGGEEVDRNEYDGGEEVDRNLEEEEEEEPVDEALQQMYDDREVIRLDMQALEEERKEELVQLTLTFAAQKNS
jgi:hypothetical protein